MHENFTIAAEKLNAYDEVDSSLDVNVGLEQVGQPLQRFQAPSSPFKYRVQGTETKARGFGCFHRYPFAF